MLLGSGFYFGMGAAAVGRVVNKMREASRDLVGLLNELLRYWPQGVRTMRFALAIWESFYQLWSKVVGTSSPAICGTLRHFLLSRCGLTWDFNLFFLFLNLERKFRFDKGKLINWHCCVFTSDAVGETMHCFGGNERCRSGKQPSAQSFCCDIMVERKWPLSVTDIRGCWVGHSIMENFAPLAEFTWFLWWF